MSKALFLGSRNKGLDYYNQEALIGRIWSQPGDATVAGGATLGGKRESKLRKRKTQDSGNK